MQQTSLDAYQSIEPSLGDRQMLVYLALKNLESANNTILAKKLNLPINTITPRILELRRMGLVEEDRKAICPLTKRMTIFWRCK